MVVKALSWALRELSKRDGAAASGFVAEHAHELAARGGRSGLRVHVLPYPLNELSREEVDPVADAYFDGLIAVMGAKLTAEEKAA